MSRLPTADEAFRRHKQPGNRDRKPGPFKDHPQEDPALSFPPTQPWIHENQMQEIFGKYLDDAINHRTPTCRHCWGIAKTCSATTVDGICHHTCPFCGGKHLGRLCPVVYCSDLWWRRLGFFPTDMNRLRPMNSEENLLGYEGRGPRLMTAQEVRDAYPGARPRASGHEDNTSNDNPQNTYGSHAQNVNPQNDDPLQPNNPGHAAGTGTHPLATTNPSSKAPSVPNQSVHTSPPSNKSSTGREDEQGQRKKRKGFTAGRRPAVNPFIPKDVQNPRRRTISGPDIRASTSKPEPVGSGAPAQPDLSPSRPGRMVSASASRQEPQLTAQTDLSPSRPDSTLSANASCQEPQPTLEQNLRQIQQNMLEQQGKIKELRNDLESLEKKVEDQQKLVQTALDQVGELQSRASPERQRTEMDN